MSNSAEYDALQIMEGLVNTFLAMPIFPRVLNGPMWQMPTIPLPDFDPPEFPPPPTSSDFDSDSIKDLDEGIECKICFRKEINVRFRECTHGVCVACTLEIWKSKVEEDDVLPSWLPCHLCRTEVNYLGALTRVGGNDEEGDAGGSTGSGSRLVTMSGETFKVSDWLSIIEWIEALSEGWSEFVREANAE
ncbi:hypothetical protein L873DRAFT_1842396 [Choiromyces venosus 120613-1]|uniref:Uncharacterized protein n=1 Tax=Choiromyces venosus 120613-1 TaxID=1336337 RepID=A0A3N4JTB6_9PEZI|nr:hypothetical protein L873DRAFT_1842396 [Choiromyces venosus 120613-1]